MTQVVTTTRPAASQAQARGRRVTRRAPRAPLSYSADDTEMGVVPSRALADRYRCDLGAQGRQLNYW
jgi:hypothetical protein